MRAARHAKRGVNRIPTELIGLLFMPASVLYLELFFRIYFISAQAGGFGDFLGRFFGAGLWLSLFFSLAAGIFLTILCTFFSKKVNRSIALVLLGIITVYFCVQAVYYHGFGAILKLTLAADTGADAVTQFAGNTVNYTVQMLWFILFAFVPFAALIVFGRSWNAGRAHGETWHALFDKPLIRFEKYPVPAKLVLALVMAVLQFIPWGLIMMTNKTTGLRAQYTSAFEHTLAAEKFGLLTTARREIAIAIGGTKDVIILPEGGDGSGEGSSQGSGSGGEGVVYAPNVMDIDFDALIENEKDSDLKKMHEYFKNRAPTKQNAYTGLFEGYNLVMITAEGFSPYAISKELTPTLYKMQQEGFRFPNFYTAGYDDTITGEFVHTTGLIPSNEVANNLKKVKNNYLPFTMGAQFQKIGVYTYGYHPHKYTYYGRNETHPNLGLNSYRGREGGVVDGKESSKYALELEHPRYWPESDLEAVQASFSDYAGKNDGKPFFAYYMSVSGHKDYYFEDNMMSWKNRELVKDLPYCEENRAYIACNIELDRAMEWLMAELEKTGQLDKTVFCITPDHKPQMLTDAQVEEMAGRKLDSEFEIYRSVFLLYCAGYKDAPEITAPANSVDIIPTLSNLFGFEYDSRLLFGRDLLDPTAEPIITLRTRSWISDKGRYNFRTKTFEKAADATFKSQEEEDAYVERVNNIVSNKFRMSHNVIFKDYYRKVFKK
ncbi:MAG: sulfatase-like hydrolase/transferase [Clostridia bacterium]|nr:sulfatase-like hydrolase/transferase [Clostridia bacterium]